MKTSRKYRKENKTIYYCPVCKRELKEIKSNSPFQPTLYECPNCGLWDIVWEGKREGKRRDEDELA